jgi:hypothetical protein
MWVSVHVNVRVHVGLCAGKSMSALCLVRQCLLCLTLTSFSSTNYYQCLLCLTLSALSHTLCPSLWHSLAPSRSCACPLCPSSRSRSVSVCASVWVYAVWVCVCVCVCMCRRQMIPTILRTRKRKIERESVLACVFKCVSSSVCRQVCV